MTDRDRLAADLAMIRTGEGLSAALVLPRDEQDADRLIALGWTRLDAERLARVLRSERLTGWLGLLVRHCGGKWSGIPLSPDFSGDFAADLAKAYREDA